MTKKEKKARMDFLASKALFHKFGSFDAYARSLVADETRKRHEELTARFSSDHSLRMGFGVRTSDAASKEFKDGLKRYLAAQDALHLKSCAFSAEFSR